ncbi:MAG: PEP-CTERM sorting domain-containing protein [Candidatus Omnitrophica bacterium]|nr:PEP-CTERM sorting domain-containing protein [Candidatus Omnitrophota bacterium]
MNGRTHRLRLSMLIGLIILAAAPARASVIFDSFGPGNSYELTDPAFITNPTDGNAFAYAQQFTPVADAVFSSVDIPIQGNAPLLYLYDLWLAEDDGGVPGNVIESFSAGTITPNGTLNSVTSLNSLLSPTLLAGTPYYVVVAAAADNTVIWQSSELALTDPVFFRLNAEPWESSQIGTLALRVNGEMGVVPEPATMLLFASGLTGAFLRRRNKRLA